MGSLRLRQRGHVNHLVVRVGEVGGHGRADLTGVRRDDRTLPADSAARSPSTGRAARRAARLDPGRGQTVMAPVPGSSRTVSFSSSETSWEARTPRSSTPTVPSAQRRRWLAGMGTTVVQLGDALDVHRLIAQAAFTVDGPTGCRRVVPAAGARDRDRVQGRRRGGVQPSSGARRAGGRCRGQQGLQDPKAGADEESTADAGHPSGAL